MTLVFEYSDGEYIGFNYTITVSLTASIPRIGEDVIVYDDNNKSYSMRINHMEWDYKNGIIRYC